MDFKTSETHKNLMRAFAGESQARNRYTFAASAAKKQQLYVIEAVFNFTANQEKEHAEIFFDHLKNLANEEIMIDAAYPVETYDDIKEMLRNARDNEHKEYDQVYKTFAKTAEQEGFAGIAYSFNEIAKIEKIHSDRFSYFLDLIEKDELFVSNTETGFMCLNCGHIVTAKEAPQVCPVCKHDRGYFIRLELVPYGGKF
ncbi:MAG: rubrerythrin family protein [Clostridia bacterium]|jgi:rubrerythrin|nr:rubrerythrin family protein [Clostridia bacterium]MCI9086579.1 rubrerythrin family protein [Clostridia bacterium]